MLNAWVRNCATIYLNRIMSAEALLQASPECLLCSNSGELFSCQECLHAEPMCASCMCSEHKQSPSHQFKLWTGQYFKPVNSSRLGYVFYLGHNGETCDKGSTRDFVLGDTNGVHKIKVHFCHHKGSRDAAHQLLRAKIFPCSDQIPATGFTFRVLRQFHHLSAGAMLSSQAFWDALVHQTNSIFPEQVPKRYRKFMRVTRQWQHLMDLKRVGRSTQAPANRMTGDLTLRCPACPLLDSNYISEDIGPDELSVSPIYTSLCL